MNTTLADFTSRPDILDSDYLVGYRSPVSGGESRTLVSTVKASFWNGPMLIAPALGTPASGTLTNTTGFPAANLAGTSLPAAIVSSSLTSLGTIATGAWQGTAVGVLYGGTGATNASGARTNLGLGTLATQSGTFSGTSSGINTGDQTITLTGDVTGTGTGSFAATLASTAVAAGSYGSASSVGTFTVDSKGRLTAAGSTGIAIAANAVSGLSTVATTGAYSDLSGKPTLGTAAAESTTYFVLASEKAANNGVATLDSGGKLTSSQVPAIAVADYLGSAANEAAMLALTGQKGDWCVRADLSTTWIISGNDPSQLSSWTQLAYPTAPVTSVNGATGVVVLSKSDVGLGNVENTALSTWAGSANITTLGTIASGTVPVARVSGLATVATSGSYTDLSSTPTLGTIASQAANSVSITGGSITGITDLAIADGGTGASTASAARVNLLPAVAANAGKVLAVNVGATDVEWIAAGVGTVTSIDISGGTTGLTASGGPVTAAGTITLAGTLAVANGGTGSGTESGARTSLGLGSIATQAANSVSITGGSITGITDLAVADGGTGASTASAARLNLLPTVAANAGKVLSVNAGATDVEWATVGTGTVTSVSVATANGVSGSVENSTTTPAITLSLGAITPTTVNGLTVTTTTGTLTLSSGKTLTANNTLTLAGTDSTVMTFPSTSATIARTDAAQTFTGTQTISTVSSPAGTALTLATGTSGTALSIASATNAVTLASTTASTSTTTGSLVVSGGVGVAGQIYAAGIQNTPIGATTPSTVTGSTIDAQTLLKGKGTATNDSAASGYIGEYISAAVAEASAISLTNATHANVTSITLTAGDWDLSGVVNLRTGSGVTTTQNIGSVHTVSATFPGVDSYQVVTYPVGVAAGALCAMPVPTFRVSVASSTTYYLLAYSAFSGGAATCTAWGRIFARRVR